MWLMCCTTCLCVYRVSLVEVQVGGDEPPNVIVRGEVLLFDDKARPLLIRVVDIVFTDVVGEVEGARVVRRVFEVDHVETPRAVRRRTHSRGRGRSGKGAGGAGRVRWRSGQQQSVEVLVLVELQSVKGVV